MAEEQTAAKSSILRVQATSKCVGQLYDHETKQYVFKGRETKFQGPVKSGSWLDSQIKAGLIEIVKE